MIPVRYYEEGGAPWDLFNYWIDCDYNVYNGRWWVDLD